MDGSAEREYSESFLAFWRVYPRRQAKSKAWEVWKKMKLDEMGAGIARHVEARAKVDRQWRDGFVPMPETFCRQRRWEDEGWEPKQTIPQSTKPVPAGPVEWPQKDGWKSNLNRILLPLIYKAGGVPDEVLERLLKGRDYYAKQFREMWGEEAPQEEFVPVMEGVIAQFRRVIEGKA